MRLPLTVDEYERRLAALEAEVTRLRGLADMPKSWGDFYSRCVNAKVSAEDRAREALNRAEAAERQLAEVQAREAAQAIRAALEAKEKPPGRIARG